MELFERLEFLSKLKFSDEEKTAFEKEFKGIVSLVDEIKAIKTPETTFNNITSSLSQLRSDEPATSTEQSLILQNAPKQKDGCYNAPLVVE